MLLSQHPIRTLMTLVVALFTTALLFTASAAQARTAAVAYTAELAAPVEATKYIIKGTVIRCNDTNCKGAKSSSSARMICARLARKTGPLVAFAYKGQAFDEAALARCNN